MHCPACGTRIWVGVGVGGGYCDEECAENGPLWRISQQIAPSLVDAEVARLRTTPCERCRREAPIEAHVAYGEDKVRTHVCCKRCGARAQFGAIGEVALATVEHFPWSLPNALRTIPMNLYGLAIRFRARTPSAALRQAAAERVAAAQQDQEREVRIQQLAEAMPLWGADRRNQADSAAAKRTLMQREDASVGEPVAAQDDPPKH